MKKVKDVFGLPVRRGIDDSLVNNDGSYIGDFWTSEMANASAHAINHADALADALEALCIAYEEREYNAIGKLALASADAAIAAYRGFDLQPQAIKLK